MNKLVVTLLMVSGFASLACRQAKYEFTKKKANTQGPEQPLNPTPTPTPTPVLGQNEFVGEDGFRMKGTPATVRVGEAVSFDGLCGTNAKEQLTWQFGDGTSGVGNKTTHTYNQSRKYQVDASCKDENGKIRKGSIIIMVDPLNPNQNPGQNPGQKPGQNPIQNPGQKL